MSSMGIKLRGFLVRSNRIKIRQNVAGATMIEFLMFFPVFLLGLFIMIWLGVAMNARGALSSAVDNGVRLAATRSNGQLYGKVQVSSDPAISSRRVGSIPQIDNWIASDGGTLDRSGLIVSDGNQLSKYDDKLPTIFHDPSVAEYDTLSKLPAAYTYAIVYIVQAMRMSTGESLRYPCDPHEAGGDNCLLCRPVNPVTFTDTDPFSPRTGTSDVSILTRRFAIRCDFKPAPYLLKPILKLLGLMTGSESGESDIGVITHYGYFDMTARCYFQGGARPRYCCASDYDGTVKCS